MGAGRPREFDPLDLAEKLHRYIATAFPFPILAEFCVENEILRPYIYKLAENCPELSDATKKCIEAKEAALEKKAALGEINASIAIFSLKQLGWKDTQNLNHSGLPAVPAQLQVQIIEPVRVYSDGTANAA